MTETNYEPTPDDKNIAVLAHLMGLFLPIVSSLTIWLLAKETSKFGSEQAREALNFQITNLLYFLAAGMLVFILVGFLIMPVLFLFYVISCVVAAHRASKGEFYQYPLTLRLIS